MKERYGNIWTMAQQAYAVCIPTNGDVNRYGKAVMGAGIALQAAKRYPWLPKLLGQSLQAEGNVVRSFQNYGGFPRWLITFPTKHSAWDERADVRLIEQSVADLNALAKAEPERTFLLPRPGCGRGNLDWGQVQPLCWRLPDNVWIVEKQPPPDMQEMARDAMSGLWRGGR